MVNRFSLTMKKVFLAFTPIAIGISICLLISLTVGIVSAQNPLVKMWDKRFGGASDDRAYFSHPIQQTADGGFILGGFSYSGMNGDKTEPNFGGAADYWIVKTDSLGTKQWDRVFGGTDEDNLHCIQQTSDGGFILGGFSKSGISGNKTQPCWGGTFYGDYWIVKTDSLGYKEWDKDFGGTSDDLLSSISQTTDGGFILGGYSRSGISGDKTQPMWGLVDYWIVKTDSLGNKQWEKDFGGFDVDYLFSIQQTLDGGFILGGYSESGISGDKTDGGWGWSDYWIIKTDSLGNKQWDKDYGGTQQDEFISIQQVSDGGYILAGSSASGIGGDKTQPNWGDWDYWIIKTDSIGIKQWDKVFGGSSHEECYNILQTVDGGYLISGDSYSSISGNKTENNLGSEQIWVAKTDSLGNLIWDKTILEPGHDETGISIQTKDGCYLMANYTNGGIGGYKTQANWDSTDTTYDYWIIKFCDSTFLPPVATAIAISLLCPGTCTNFTNLSSFATSYQWSFPGATPPTSTDLNPTNICYSNPGTFDVQLIATNANGSDTLLLTNYITVYPSPPAQSISQIGDTLFSIAGSASYQWYFNGNIINGATNYFYVATQSGDYNLIATDFNGCEVEAVINDVLASVQFAVGSLQLAIYPNPVIDELTIRNLQVKSGTAETISIYNLIGEKVLAVQLPTVPKLQDQLPTCSIDVSVLLPGIYWLDVSSEGKTFRAKFVKY